MEAGVTDHAWSIKESSVYSNRARWKETYMSGSGGGGFVIEGGTLLLVMLGFAVLVGTWIYLLSQRRR
jgi:hypothetical protein